MKKISMLTVLLLTLSVAGCLPIPTGTGGGEGTGIGNNKSPGNFPESTPESQSFTGETTTVVLYFAGTEGQLVAEQREVPKVEGIARKTMEELCKGPGFKELRGTMPPDTRLLDINIRDGLCIVDFSRELVENHPGGSSGELLTVYSIINTLTQFPSVHEVVIRVEGERVQTLAGHVDLSVPLERNADILKG